ncbi:hypothetical protein BGX24_010735 [Mortierella sp. AD032]|nr:hypothetical protein BGX24_010735 [Mortierella sp. AD032]
MNNVKEIQRLNAREATLSTSHSQTGSWHEQYKDSAHVFVGGLPYNLTEGDIICVVSQFGEVAGINLVRDKDTGKSKGYAFLKYVDQRSTILAVDNLNGAQLAGRTIRVDHVQNYKVPKVFDADGNEVEPDEETVNNAAPKPIQEEDSEDDDSSESEVDDTGIDIDDPMREYLLKKRKKEARKAKRKSESKAEKKSRKEAKKAAKREKGQDKDGGSKKSSKRSSKDKESSPLLPTAAAETGKSSTAMRDEDDKGDEAMDVDVKKDDFADKISKDSSVAATDRNTSGKEATARASPPHPSSSSHQRLPISRSRSPRPRQHSNDRHRGRSPNRGPSPSRERYRDSRDDYTRNSRRRGDSRDRRRDDNRDRSRRDDSRDRHSSSRKRSPSPDYGRRRGGGGGYSGRDSRGSRYRSRSRTPPRRSSRRSRTRSLERP